MELHRPLDTDLESLRNRLLLLGGETEAAFARATYALVARDSDAAQARALIARDDEIDILYDRVFHDLLRLMSREPDTTTRAARLLFVAKHIERIGDYVTDICELTVYMTEAEYIKHSN